MTSIAAVHRYLQHEDRAVRFAFRSAPSSRFEPAALLAHPLGRRSVRLLAERCRATRWANEPTGSPLHALALGQLVEREPAADALGSDLTQMGLAAGMVVEAGPRFRLAFGVMAIDDLMVPVPREPDGPDRIYLGPEAHHLDDVRGALDITGDCAYVGAGSGHLAVVLARRCSRVVATDVLPRCAAMTSLALEMNADVLTADRRTEMRAPPVVAVADLSSGLRPESFDLVVANPPWVPTSPGAPMIYAEGGPTGCELPIRFLREGLGLVRPGGTVVLTTLDPTLADGRRPLLDAIDALDARFVEDGVVVTMFPTPLSRHQPDFEERLLRYQPRLRAARHVALVAERVDPSTVDDMEMTHDRLARLPARLATTASWPAPVDQGSWTSSPDGRCSMKVADQPMRSAGSQ